MQTKEIFSFDPILGCPFDDSEMRMVEEWKGFRVGERVEFLGPNDLGTTHRPWIQGDIIAIGENAKYSNGDPFVAFVVRVGNYCHFKTHRYIHHVL